MSDSLKQPDRGRKSWRSFVYVSMYVMRLFIMLNEKSQNVIFLLPLCVEPILEDIFFLLTGHTEPQRR